MEFSLRVTLDNLLLSLALALPDTGMHSVGLDDPPVPCVGLISGMASHAKQFSRMVVARAGLGQCRCEQIAMFTSLPKLSPRVFHSGMRLISPLSGGVESCSEHLLACLVDAVNLPFQPAGILYLHTGPAAGIQVRTHALQRVREARLLLEEEFAHPTRKRF